MPRGDNSDGELGDGTTTAHYSPQPVTRSSFSVVQVSAGSGFCLAAGSAPAVAPAFATASPPLAYAAGDGAEYTFSATGWPAPAYALSAQSPAWLTSARSPARWPAPSRPAPRHSAIR